MNCDRVRWTAWALLAVVGPACSAELVVRDLRVGLGTGDPSADYRVQGRTVDASGHISFQRDVVATIGTRWSFSMPGRSFGPVVGFDLLRETAGFGGGEIATMGGSLSAGWGWAPADACTMVVEAAGWTGRSTLHQPASAAVSDYRAEGSATAGVLRIDTTWQLGRQWLVSASGGWQMSRLKLSGDGLDTHIDRSGWIVGLALVWRFDIAPSPLQ